MSIKQRLKSGLKDLMRAQDRVRVEAVRMLLSAIQYEEMQKNVEELADDAVLSVLQGEQKKRREEIEFAEKANRSDAVAKLKIELSLIESFLPQQLSESELDSALKQFRAADPALNMGMAMKLLKEKFPGQYDGKLASEIAKRVFA